MKLSGAVSRHTSQSIHEESTYHEPETFSFTLSVLSGNYSLLPIKTTRQDVRHRPREEYICSKFLRVSHFLGLDQSVEIFTREQTKLDGRLAQTDLFLVSVFCYLRGVVVTDVRIQSGY